jgi:hypothetical protein
LPSASVRQRRHSTEHPHREGGNGRPNACWLFWVVGVVDRLRRELSIGDVLIAVDGEDTSAQTHEAIVALLAEKRGVEKTLTVRRCLSSAHGAVGKELPSGASFVPPGRARSRWTVTRRRPRLVVVARRRGGSETTRSWPHAAHHHHHHHHRHRDRHPVQYMYGIMQARSK